jgi:6,7-dimethyl-8-ribityllumazine synthase
MRYRIAVISSRFNEEITTLLRLGVLETLELRENPVAAEDIFLVPGAIEIPFVAACLARKKHYDAIICLGAVIRGETNHYDYVCWQVSYGCQKVAIEYNIPVIFGVLTTDNELQALNRCGGSHGHKGRECADAALEMINLLKKINSVSKTTPTKPKRQNETVPA